MNARSLFFIPVMQDGNAHICYSALKLAGSLAASSQTAIEIPLIVYTISFSLM